MDSLSLDWQISSAIPLHHFYVEKGAGEPTPLGTHLDQAAPGYRWTGWSTTYAHDVPGRGREIIPYEAVFPLQRQPTQAGTQGLSSVGERASPSIARSADLRSQLGLDPEPGPVLTRLAAGGSIESPVVFLGAFAGGPDGAGNQLRPWVRAVLGSPRTWADSSFPLTVNNSWGAGMQVDESIAHRMIADSARPGPGDVPPRCRLVSRGRGLVSESQKLSPRISSIGR